MKIYQQIIIETDYNNRNENIFFYFRMVCGGGENLYFLAQIER